ncbi:MAG: DUF885 family protein [Acidobacteria bacterium]|nr:DUF885 family protein [Acidobacteriota bacterium]
MGSSLRPLCYARCSVPGLRELAERGLGDEFDIKEFHDRVLEDGSVPLIMLREKIERWLEQ